MSLDYYQTLETMAFPVSLEKLLENPDFSDWCSALVDEVESDSDAFMNRMQAVLSHEPMVYSIGELLQASVVQQQRGLNPKVIARILTDPKTGLVKNGMLLRDPEVAVNPDGSLTLIGGNHRIACVYMLLTAGGADVDTIKETQIRCEQYTVDRGLLTELLTVQDEHGRSIVPTPEIIDKTHRGIILDLWLASNSSRSMVPSEIQDAELHARGVDRTDNDSVLDNLFPPRGKAKTINAAEATRIITSNIFDADERRPLALDPETGMPVYSVDTMKRYINALGMQSVLLTRVNFEKIMKSAASALLSNHTVTIPAVKRDGTPTEKTVKIYADDLKDRELFLEYCELFTTVIEEAIDNVMSAKAGSEFAGNVGRFTAEIGERVAGIVAERTPPTIDMLADKPKEQATKKPARKAGLGFSL